MDPEKYVEENNLCQICDESELSEFAESAIATNPAMVSGFISGKSNLEKALMGAAMSLSGGRANPGMLQEIMHRKLEDIRKNS